MKINTDIDIDVADRDSLLRLIPHVAAIQKDGSSVRKHNTGVYFHEMPTNPLTGNATIGYKEAEDLGYFKIDVLNVGLYKQVKSPEHLDKLCEIDPDWNMLTNPSIVSILFQLANHVDITVKKAPKNINQLAMLLALIRPAKRHLAHLGWDAIEKSIWTRTEDEGYLFRRSHSLGYAMAIIVQLNLISGH
jgi:hypothetical protein